jgi:hypothetical protein
MLTDAVFGSIVQNGMFSAGTFRFERRLNVLLLPMFAIPRNPIFREVPVRPSLTLFVMPLAWEKYVIRVPVKLYLFIIIIIIKNKNQR